jgi:hypothetical protein
MAETRPEAERLLRIAGSELEAYQMIERQLSVLVLRTQVVLSLAGIVITVTGFSGQAIARTSTLARACIAVGIAVVLASAIIAIFGVLRLRWLSQTLGDDPLANVAAGLELRDRKSRYLGAALILFAIGFSFYVVAIVQLLAATPTS